jgi:hypothetical protein
MGERAGVPAWRRIGVAAWRRGGVSAWRRIGVSVSACRRGLLSQNVIEPREGLFTLVI